MKTIAAEIPDRLESALAALVAQGWYASREQVLEEALRRFLETRHPEVMEQFVRQDVEWGLHGRT